MFMLISFSSRTSHLPPLPKVPKAGSMTMVLMCLIGQQTRLTWTPQRICIVILYCQDKRHQTQQCRWHEGHYQSNLGFHYTWAVPQDDCLHATPHWCSNSCKRRPNQVLSAYKWTYFSEAWLFCLKYPFLLIFCNIQIFWDTELWVFIICKP